MKSNLFFLFGVVLALVVSGCTSTGGGGTAPTGGSVVIKSFAVIGETAIQGNDKVKMVAEFANSGDSKATAVRLQIVGPDLNCDVPPCPSTSSDKGLRWGLQSGKRFTGPSEINDLKPIVVGEEAVSKTYSWTLQAPQLPANLVLTDPAIIARLSFAYWTEAIKQIRVVTASEYQRLKARGETLAVGTSQPSNGPIILDVAVREPVRIDDDSATADFTLSVTGTNAANGNAFLGEDPNTVEFKDLIKLKLTLPSDMKLTDTSDDCQQLIAGTYQAPLTKGQSETQQKFKISCDVSTPKPAVSVDKIVRIRADYGYFTDARLSTPLTITGKASYAAAPAADSPTGGAVSDTPPTPPAGGAGIDNVAPNVVTGLALSVLSKQLNPTTQLTTGKWLTNIQFIQPADNVGVTAFEIVIANKNAVGYQTPAINNWNSFTKYSPVPAVVGTNQYVSANNVVLDGNIAYIICVVAKDAKGNLSPPACVEKTTAIVTG